MLAAQSGTPPRDDRIGRRRPLRIADRRSLAPGGATPVSEAIMAIVIAVVVAGGGFAIYLVANNGRDWWTTRRPGPIRLRARHRSRR